MQNNMVTVGLTISMHFQHSGDLKFQKFSGEAFPRIPLKHYMYVFGIFMTYHSNIIFPGSEHPPPLPPKKEKSWLRACHLSTICTVFSIVVKPPRTRISPQLF